jgi:osmotically-inducible protein OsmY
VGLAAGAGAAVGVAATKEGGLVEAASDARIATNINDLWFRSNVDMFRKLNLSVEQGRVLITGVVQDPNHRVEAVRLAWQPRGVKQVINEIRVADSDGLPGYVRDTWISTQLRGKMLLNADIQSINYTIDTVQGVVYLMGVARSQAELDLVIETARKIKHVDQVISYVKMLGEPVLSRTVNDMGTSSAAPAAAESPVIDSSTSIAPEPEAVERVTLPP